MSCKHYHTSLKPVSHGDDIYRSIDYVYYISTYMCIVICLKGGGSVITVIIDSSIQK